MISKAALQKIANTYQTTELNARREYFQHLFLSLFYAQSEMEHVYFKGGTALRLLYGSPRFSEDLDFDSSSGRTAAIEDAILETLANAEREGISTELDEAKKTTGGYLSTMRFVTPDDTVSIRIEISFRTREQRGQGNALIGQTTLIASDLFPDYTVVQLVEEQLVQGKIAALLDRKKPRDFYDFYFLLRHNMVPKKRDVFESVLLGLEERDLNFEGLKEFLPKSHHMIIRDFKNTLKREIQRYL
jgi:predicted nucleotidyltransferase component of viral defense system